MVNIVHIACPECHNHSQIYLSINPSVIILNCPECGAPLIMEGSSVKLAKENHGSTRSSIRDLLDIFNNHQKKNELNSEEYSTPLLPEIKSRGTLDSFHPEYETKECITDDDLINLKIDLERSYDIQDFISVI